MLHNQNQMMQQLQNPQVLEQVLLGLLDPSSVQKATETLTDFLQDVKSCPPLIHVICNSSNNHARNLAAVYLRSKFSSYATELGNEEEQTIRNTILRRLIAEEDLKVLRSLGQLCIKVAKVFPFGDNQQDIFQAVKALLAQNVNERTEVAITMLRNLVPLSEGEPFDVYLGTFRQGLKNGSERMQLESLKGLQALAVQCEEEEDENVRANRMTSLAGLYQDMAAVCQVFVEHDDEAIARYVVEMWGDLFLDNCLKGSETQIYKFMLEVGKKTSLHINVRYQVVEYMKVYCQARPNLFMQENLLEPTMEFCINLLMESQKHTEDEDDVSNPLAIAIEVLDAVFLNVRSDKTTPLALKGVQLLIEQKHESAALSLLAIMAEGCADLLISDQQTVTGIYQLLKQGMSSGDPRTRKVAYEAVTQFVYHLSPTMNQYADELMPAIFQALEGEQNNAENLEAVCIVLDSYSSALQDKIKPFVFKLFESLFGLLKSSKIVDVQTAAISAISSSLMTTRECKVPVQLDGLTEVLLRLVKTNDSNLIKLKPEAINCLGEICLTVGREDTLALHNSTDFISEIIKLCASTEESEIRENSFAFFSHLGQLFKEDLLSTPHFNNILKLCLDCIESEDGVVTAKPDDGFGSAGAPGIDEDENDELATKFYVVTGFLEEKTAAAMAIENFAKFCGAGFQECWDRVYKEILDCMQYPHPALKQQSIRTMHAVIMNMINCLKEGKCMNDELKNQAQEYIQMMVTVYLVSLAREDNKDCAVETLISLAALLEVDCQGILGLNGKDPKQIADGPEQENCSWEELMEIVLLLLQEQITCQAPEDIELTEAKRATEDNPILDGITDVTTSLCKGLTETQLVRYWEQVFPELPRYLTPQRSHVEFSLAIGTMGDVSAHLSPQSIQPFLEQSVKMAFAGLEASQHHLVRQNSIFALGCLCRAGRSLMEPYLETLLKILDPICQQPRNQPDKKDQLLRDNAMSTLGSVLAFCADKFPDQHFLQFVQIFLNGLPMEADLAENEHVARNIVRILETRANLMQPHMQLCKNLLENSLQWKEMPQDLVSQIRSILQNSNQNQTSI